MSLSIGIATRGRHALLLKTITETLPNIKRDDTKIVVLADRDDKETIVACENLPERVKVDVRAREDSRGEKYDRLLTIAPASLYLPTVDAAPFLTPGFDQKFLDAAAAFPDGIGCVYTAMANASFPGILAPTAKLVEKLGHIYNHDYPFWFIDHELDDICRMIGRFIFADVEFQHLAWRPSKTIRLRDLAFWTGYFDVMALERRAQARAIIYGDDFKSPEWLKRVLANSYQVVEARSKNINAGVRSNAEAIERARGEEGPPDPGYLRAKQRAENKLAAFLQSLRAAA